MRQPSIRILAAMISTTLLMGSLTVVGRIFEPATAAAIGATPLKVVLIGESYAAGNGARDADNKRNYTGPKGCYRSPTNWAAQYGAWLDSQGYQVTLVNRACSAATTHHYMERRRMDERVVVSPAPAGSTSEQFEQAALDGPCKTPYPGDESYSAEHVGAGKVKCTRYMEAQIDAIDQDTDLVLITGGNDVKFGPIITHCFAPILQAAGDCRRAVEETLGKLGEIEELTKAVLNKIRERARPDVKVALVGYPYLVNSDAFQLTTWWEPGSYAAASEVRSLGREGDDAQRSAVSSANAAAGTNFVTFVDRVKSHFTGHEPEPELGIANPDRWMNEIEFGIILREMYHYNAKGHAQIAVLLRDYGTFGAASRQ